MPASKCIVILSEKSSGSSLLQNVLVRSPGIRCISRTRHFEKETLYWTKAASILGLSQLDAADSEVPLQRNAARSDLIQLLSDNIENYIPPDQDDELIFGGWRLLCRQYRPVFIEKSPHHLYQWACLELILQCIQRLKDVDFMLVGLVRNPMDTIYSQFKRWKIRPERVEMQWVVAYKNLMRLKPLLREKLLIVRYEDLTATLNPLKRIMEFCGIDLRNTPGVTNRIHRNSLNRWKSDRFYGFTLSYEAMHLAADFAYPLEDLINYRHNPFWPAYRELSRLVYRTATPVIDAVREISWHPKI